jgi:hypothetical protein
MRSFETLTLTCHYCTKTWNAEVEIERETNWLEFTVHDPKCPHCGHASATALECEKCMKELEPAND